MRHVAQLILIIAVAFSAASAGAQELCSSTLLGESWYITEQVAKNKFVTNSDIYYFKQYMQADFSASLAKLGPQHHLLDLGAGKAVFLIDFLKTFKDVSQAPQATAVSYKINRLFPLPKFKGKLEAKEGVFEMMDISTWKKADMITDNFGVISYSHDLHTTFQKVFDLLNVHGELYINSTNFGANFVALGTMPNMTMGDFLKTIPGLRVEGQWGSLKVTKMEEIIRIPHMHLTRFKEGFPPSRTFEIRP